LSRVAIVTDTTNCLPEAVIRELEIKVVPVRMVIGTTQYRDGIDITPQKLFEMFDELPEKPVTAAASPGDFAEIFLELGKTTSNIACILVSKALTATYESAFLARRLVRTERPEMNIQILDSRTSAGALGFIVREAAIAARAGKTLDEVVKVVQDMSSRVIYLAALDTLKYIMATGRTVRGTAVGEALNVKPIIGFVDDSGQVEVVARTTGKDKAVARMLDLVGKYVDAKKPLHFLVHHTHNPDDGQSLAEAVKKRFRCVELDITDYTAVMLSSTGPMVGMAFYQDGN
jgi:DegV family protein with EDD domain